MLILSSAGIRRPHPSWRRISSGVGGGVVSFERRSRYSRTRCLGGWLVVLLYMATSASGKAGALAASMATACAGVESGAGPRGDRLTCRDGWSPAEDRWCLTRRLHRIGTGRVETVSCRTLYIPLRFRPTKPLQQDLRRARRHGTIGAVKARAHTFGAVAALAPASMATCA